jgi:peptidoglycan/LPS O-acetylase OafA/YrhL
MWESWSLSVHEWFYVLFPALLLTLFYFLKSRLSKKFLVLIAILSMTFFSIVYRVQLDNNLDWDLYYRKLVLSRLDSIGIGLLAAYIKIYHPSIFHAKYYWTLILGIIVYHLSWRLSYQSDFFNKVPYLTLISIAIAFTIPWFDQIKSLGKFNLPVYWLSQISYSFYLLHLPLLQSIITLKKHHQIDWNWQWVLPLYITVAIALSFALHLLYEKKFIEFGNRFR